VKKNRFVLDVNIWVSIFLGKQTAWLVQKIKECKFEIISCPELYNELSIVLHRPKFKKYISASDIKEALALHTKISKQVKNIKILPTFADSDDDYLLALAIKSKATYIVTGDKLVLNTPVTEPISIITLADFKTMLQ
jgi:putative PIN family toxin of toxin-antitoxin system